MEHNKLRMGHLLVIIVVAVGLVAGRLAWLQLGRHEELAAKALAGQQELLAGEEIVRGDIVDREGRSLTGAGLYPGLVVLPGPDIGPEELNALSTILNQEAEVLARRLERSPGSFIMAPLLTPQQARAVEELASPRLQVAPVFSHYGPQPLAVHLVGHLGPRSAGAERTGPGGDLAGVKGLEAVYDDYLRQGQPAYWLPVVKDGQGRVLPEVSLGEVITRPDPGRYQIVTTIDLHVQAAVEAVMEAWVPRGAVVILEPDTGDVLAMASRPSFDPRHPVAGNQEGQFVNRALEHYYPGSVFKIVLAAAALEQGVVTPAEKFFCTGSYVLASGQVYSCWKPEGHGALTLSQALAQSCNPTFIELGLRLGRGQLMQYAQAFGLDRDRLVGYPLPEAVILDIDYGDGALANASLGQEGVRLSPLQVGGIVAAVANGGIYHPPRVVREIRRAGQVERSFAVPAGYRAVSPATAAQLQDMLEQVVRTGTGREAWVEVGGSAGKTGTAESGTRDAAGRPVTYSWFAGWYPLEKPRYAVAVYKENVSASDISASAVFRRVLLALLDGDV